MSGSGRLLGVGVGPGDPELMTLKAVRALARADVVAYFAKSGNRANGFAVAANYLRSGAEELPLLYPVTTEIPKCDSAYRDSIRDFFDGAAASISARLDAGLVVAVVCEGDPLFYGSYMHLHARLAPRYPTEVIAGVSGISGCWSVAGLPIAQGDDVLTVLSGALPEPELARRLEQTDAIVVIKLGRNLPKVRRALARTGRLDRAIYVERGTTPEAVVMRLAEKPDEIAPYFAVVLVPGWESRL